MQFFKKFFGVEETQAPERRGAYRREMTCVCATSFVDGYGEKRALLLDLSLTGARFGTAIDARDIALDRGQVVSFHVSTPYGAASWTGRVVWTCLSETIYTWGVQFTEVPEPAQGPLKRLLAVGQS